MGAEAWGALMVVLGVVAKLIFSFVTRRNAAKDERNKAADVAEESLKNAKNISDKLDAWTDINNLDQ